MPITLTESVAPKPQSTLHEVFASACSLSRVERSKSAQKGQINGVRWGFLEYQQNEGCLYNLGLREILINSSC